MVAGRPEEAVEPGGGRPRKGVPLSQLLAGVATAVEQAFRQGVWTTAEIVRVDGDTSVYLELAERDPDDTLIAKARAIVWRRDVSHRPVSTTAASSYCDRFRPVSDIRDFGLSAAKQSLSRRPAGGQGAAEPSGEPVLLAGA